MKYTSATLWTAATASICHLVMIYVFLEKFDWGFEGVAIATSIHFVIRFTVSTIHLYSLDEFKKIDDVYIFSRETTENLGY